MRKHLIIQSWMASIDGIRRLLSSQKVSNRMEFLQQTLTFQKGFGEGRKTVEIDAVIGSGSGLAYYPSPKGLYHILIHVQSGHTIPRGKAGDPPHAQALLRALASLINWKMDYRELRAEMNQRPLFDALLRETAERQWADYLRQLKEKDDADRGEAQNASKSPMIKELVTAYVQDRADKMKDESAQERLKQAIDWLFYEGDPLIKSLAPLKITQWTIECWTGCANEFVYKRERAVLHDFN